MHTNGWMGIMVASVLLAAASLNAAPSEEKMAQAPVQKGSNVVGFPSAFPHFPKQFSHTGSQFDYKKERFLIYVPASYTGRDPYGLIVFVDPGKARTTLPAGWDAVLDQKKFLFIAPQDVGNSKNEERRNGMALTSALAMMRYYNIDRTRLYAAGFSGGARIASLVAFYAPEIFKGTIQSCGTDFYKAVPKTAVTSADTTAHPEGYGVASISQAEASNARSRVKFVLITGPKDFRYHFIQDIYNGGFQPEHFKATLLDIPGMGHQVCGAAALTSALDFLGQP